jgi:glycine cleavage system H lipoate-binding protein/ABC-type phosphate transport system substrate-binding protein
MKTKIRLFISLLLLLTGGMLSSKAATHSRTAIQEGSISILSAPELFELSSKWASNYCSLNPEVKIKVINSPNENSGASENISIISDKSESVITNETNWKMVVGRNIIVPVMNTGNPFLNEILKRGISPGQVAQLFESTAKQNWGSILSNKQNALIHIYLLNDESVKAGVAKLIKETQIMNSGITLGTKDEVIAAIQKDPYAIGFCKVMNVISSDNQNLIENVRLLPLDRNGNGNLDHMEDIYGDINLFMRGVWIGKYPKALYNNIYAITNTQPTNETELAFFRWLITDGQKFLNPSGYCDLVSNESQAQLDKLNTVLINEPNSKMSYSITDIILLLLVGLAALSLIISMIYRISINKKPAISVTDKKSFPGFNENTLAVPPGLYFDKTHTWAFMEKDGYVTIGIDDFLQHITGTITRIEMKNPKEKFKKGDLLFSIIQAGKQLHIYAPISGIIKKQNEALISESSYLNSAPYTEGWVYKIEPTNWLKEIQLLDMAEKYKRWLDTEFSRVKDFLAAALRPDSLEYSLVVLQDGGVLKDGVLADFGPEIWEDFQTNFLDNYK